MRGVMLLAWGDRRGRAQSGMQGSLIARAGAPYNGVVRSAVHAPAKREMQTERNQIGVRGVGLPVGHPQLGGRVRALPRCELAIGPTGCQACRAVSLTGTPTSVSARSHVRIGLGVALASS